MVYTGISIYSWTALVSLSWLLCGCLCRPGVDTVSFWRIAGPNSVLGVVWAPKHWPGFVSPEVSWESHGVLEALAIACLTHGCPEA